MIEVYGNLWDYGSDSPTIGKIITTNGSLKANGACVMGRGCAKEAKDKFYGIDHLLGSMIKSRGNHCFLLQISFGSYIFSFPVKHKWFEVADLKLIEQSAKELVELTTHLPSVVLPRPGCGNGQLEWSQVRPVIYPVFAPYGEKFKVITFKED